MDILLVGSSFSAAPMLFDLKRRGTHVTVVGKHEDDPCHAYADNSIYIDYSDPAELLEVCRTRDFMGIVPSCNDYAYVAAAKVAATLGYPGFDTLDIVEILHEKDRFRQFCASIGVPAPRIYGEVTVEAKSVKVHIPGSALVKPVDSFSGRGVERVHDSDYLPAAIDRALAQSRNKRAVVEEFVDGDLHSHTAFIAGSEIVWHEFVDEFCETYPYQVDRSAYPSALTVSLRTEVHESLTSIVRALGLVDGLLHTQFIASKDSFWIIECMRRCPGDLYSQHFQLAAGQDYTHEYVSPFLGLAPKAPVSQKTLRRVERQVISTEGPQAFFGVSFNTGARPATFIPLKKSGEKLAPAPFDKAGILFLEGRDGEDPACPFAANISRTVQH